MFNVKFALELIYSGFLLSFGFAAGELVMVKWAALWVLLHSSY